MAQYFQNNIKYLRNKYNISQLDLADKVGIDRSTISRIENAEIDTTVENVKRIADALNLSLNDLYCKDLTKGVIPFDVADKFVEVPVSYTLKNGIVTEELYKIIDYVAVSRTWLNNDNAFFATKICDNSIYPHYKENDIIIFEKTKNYASANKKDCIVLIDDNTFIKNVSINKQCITLTPLSENNDDNKILKYNNEQILRHSLKILGIFKERRTY